MVKDRKAPCAQGQVIELEITDLNHRGEGVGKTGGFIVFVPQALPGEIVKKDMGVDEDLFSQEQGLPEDFKMARSRFEAWFLDCKLKEYEGNISKLAEAIGLERSYLYRKLKSYEIGSD